jgi:hypothetical protein
MYKIKTKYGETYDVTLKFGKYSNGRTAIELIDCEDGFPLMTATVNLPDAEIQDDEVIIKNYSENEGVLEFLIKNEIVSPPTRTIPTGWVTCQVVKLLKTN